MSLLDRRFGWRTITLVAVAAIVVATGSTLLVLRPWEADPAQDVSSVPLIEPTATSAGPPLALEQNSAPVAAEETPAVPDQTDGSDAPVEQQPQVPQAPPAPSRPSCPAVGLMGQLTDYKVERGGNYEYVLTARGVVANMSGQEIVLGDRDTPDLHGYDERNRTSVIELYGEWDRPANSSGILILAAGEKLGYTINWQGYEHSLLDTRRLNSTPEAGGLFADYNSGAFAQCSPLARAGGGVDVPFSWTPPAQ